MKQKEVVIFAPAAKSGGALSVLIDFIIACGNRPTKTFTVFVPEKIISELPSFNNVNCVPLKLNSYLRRVFYDFYGINKFISKNYLNGANVLCISNTGILSSTKNKQWIMVHNTFAISKSIPNNIKKSKRLMFYISLYPYYLIATFRKRHTYIVQRKSLETQLMTSYRSVVQNVITVTPTVGDTFIKASLNIKSENLPPTNNKYYFCPVRETLHKNIKLIHDIAINYIQDETLFILTISENYYIDNISNKIPSNIRLAGNISLLEMASFYEHSTAVIFPSLVETAGLPLLEAAHFQKHILVSNLEYAHDLLGSYNGAIFIDPENPEEWLNTLKNENFGKTPNKLIKPEKSFSGYILDKILDAS